MSVTLYRVSAFPKEGIGGNEAGVVLDAQGLSDKQMLSIAKRVNYSETAFVFPSEKADYKLRYFTPAVEVPLCGHATIATFNLMRNLELLTKQEITIETLEGVLQVYIDPDFVSLQLAKPLFGDTISKAHIEKTLGINQQVILDYPIQVVSTGIPEIFMGVNSLETLKNLTLNEEAIVALCKEYKALGLYIYTLETEHDSDAHGRNFIPLVGIYEESATGTASGALACYLDRYHPENKKRYAFEQGYTLFKPSCIQVYLKKENKKLIDVYVGGRMRFIDKIIGFNPEN